MRPIVESFFHAITGTWSHIVSDPATSTAAIIDSVLDFDPASGRAWAEQAQLLLAHVRDRNLIVEWILETHAHADHLSAADWLKRALGAAGQSPMTGIGAGIVLVQKHFRDVFALGPDFAADGSQFDRLYADGEHFAIGALDAHVIATPGHTSDGITYLIDDAVFVGDTLFAPHAGTGRCDFPGADAATQYRSIRRLYELPETTRVYLCHDYPTAGTQAVAQTTISAQKSGNTQLNATTSEIDYVAMRTRRDATLPVPRLLYPSLQVNICAGRLPPPEPGGGTCLRLPLTIDI